MCCATWKWFFCSQSFVEVFIEAIHSIFKESKAKKVILLAVKNIPNGNYSNAVNLTNKVVFNKNLKFINVFHANVTMKKIFVNINSDLRIVKYKKTKLIKFNSVKIVKIIKRLKKLAQIIKKQLNSVDVVKQILNTFIVICLRELLNISFELFKQMFRSIIDEEIKAILKEIRIIAQSKNIKEKKVHIDSMRLNSIKSVHLK